jgi:hypothetical protein
MNEPYDPLNYDSLARSVVGALLGEFGGHHSYLFTIREEIRFMSPEPYGTIPEP